MNTPPIKTSRTDRRRAQRYIARKAATRRHTDQLRADAAGVSRAELVAREAAAKAGKAGAAKLRADLDASLAQGGVAS